MVGDVRIARGIELQLTGAAERKEREPKLCWMEWGQESGGQRSKANGLIDDNKCAK